MSSLLIYLSIKEFREQISASPKQKGWPVPLLNCFPVIFFVNAFKLRNNDHGKRMTASTYVHRFHTAAKAVTANLEQNKKDVLRKGPN